MLIVVCRLANQAAFFHQPVPEGWQGFAYVYEGKGIICGTPALPQVRAVRDCGMLHLITRPFACPVRHVHPHCASLHYNIHLNMHPAPKS